MRGLRRGGLWAAAGGVALCTGLGGAASAETLLDALALAYQTNPTLQSERAQLRALDESYIQARAGLRPQVSASAEFDHTKSPLTEEDIDEQASASVTVSQSLYTGGSVTAQMRAAMNDIESGRQKLRETEAAVFQAVIQAYEDVRRDQQSVLIGEDGIAALRRQLDETDARFRAGDLTRTDQAEAQARLAAAQAQLATAQAQLQISRSNYVVAVGQAPADLAEPAPLQGVPVTVDEAFDATDHNNGGVLSAEYAERAAAQRVAQAKAANRPTLSLQATYGESGAVRIQGLYGYTQNLIPGANITASAVFTQPLFTGGMNSSRIREALENDNVQTIAIETARRQAVQAVAQSWAQLLAARAGVTSYQKQVDADEVAFDGARQEAQAGLRTTIDVLNEEQELNAARLALVGAKHDEYIAEADILDATGRLEARYILSGVKLYDPAKTFKKNVDGGIGIPWDGPVMALDALGAPGAPKAAKAGAEVLP